MQTQQSFAEHDGAGTLYLVPTPIGNLQDMTYRAVETLQTVDLICAEDTRNTQKLLNHFEIETKQISFHEHNTQERIPQLIEKLQAGQNLAQVSDAGMPSISDPGTELVAACVQAGVTVVPLPGANAGLTALIASGLVPQPFYFYGFLSRKKSEQKAELAALSQHQETVIIYESPFRVAKTLANLATVCEPTRPIVACRELTKRYEEFARGTLAELVDWSQNHQLKGEFVLLIGGNPNEPTTEKQDELAELPLKAQVEALIAAGDKPNVAIKTIAKRRNVARQVVYNEFHEI
ncbi:16S rRNA (cytidine(1402)-2'-O)-methyltransferase [Lactiplantibacillus fabifermentans]|uniref:Ribosomal RNA small subunit methyltransferase I n=2 Tax=Lactiplantibacillus fabifermentans TaxID=483011 RepID=A0A0R2NDY0_9LACO|nr:16S rRNA (cytidine(1402)-2'-O)-methyltransferase [Lactiplantibacillus fabifermentans]ETY75242.1 16S rRNA methyltransferase [Lactiplantibacillus fabifermentans T30PCM01]KRO24055.1 methyltransferase [Lactiplantibacillus fabifermentans DSM 21115]